MSNSVNKVILVGHLGQEPEKRFMPDGKPVTSFSVATNGRKNKDKQSITDWHRVVCFEKLAELCAEYLHKGRQVYVEGRLKTRSYQDKEGQKQYRTEVIGKNVIFLGKPSDASPIADTELEDTESGEDECDVSETDLF